jgi:hypothetical protein
LVDPSAANITGNADTGWTYWNEDSLGNNFYTTSGVDISTPDTRWLEVEVSFATTTSDTPVVDWINIAFAGASDDITLDLPPAPFDLVSPSGGGWGVPSPTFTWQASSDTGSGLAKYQLFIDNV